MQTPPALIPSLMLQKYMQSRASYRLPRIRLKKKKEKLQGAEDPKKGVNEIH